MKETCIYITEEEARSGCQEFLYLPNQVAKLRINLEPGISDGQKIVINNAQFFAEDGTIVSIPVCVTIYILDVEGENENKEENDTPPVECRKGPKKYIIIGIVTFIAINIVNDFGAYLRGDLSGSLLAVDIIILATVIIIFYKYKLKKDQENYINPHIDPKNLDSNYVKNAMQFIAVYEELHLKTLCYFVTPTRFGAKASDDTLGISIKTSYEIAQREPGPPDIWYSLFVKQDMEKLGGEMVVEKLRECYAQVGLYDGDFDYPVIFIRNSLRISSPHTTFLQEADKYIQYIEKQYKSIYKRNVYFLPYDDFKLTSCFCLPDDTYDLLEKKREELSKEDEQMRRATEKKIHDSVVFQTIFSQITTCINVGVDNASKSAISRIGVDTFQVTVQLNKLFVTHTQKSEPSDNRKGLIKLNIVFKDLAADELDYEQGQIFYLELADQLKKHYENVTGISISYSPQISLEQYFINSRWEVKRTLDGVSLRADYTRKRESWDMGGETLCIDIDLKDCHPKQTYGTW